MKSFGLVWIFAFLLPLAIFLAFFLPLEAFSVSPQSISPQPISLSVGLMSPSDMSLDFWSWLGGGINQIVGVVIGALFSLLNALLYGVSTMIWGYAFGFLNPKNAFPTFPFTNIPPPHNFYIANPTTPDFSTVTVQGFATVSANWALYFIDYLVIPILSIMIVIYGILYAFDVLRGKGESIFDSLPKIVFGIVLAFTSIMLASLLMEFGQALYSILWYGVSFNGTTLRGLNQLQQSPLPNVSLALVFNISSQSLAVFIFLFILITILISFILMLAVRLIWIFTSVILLPIASILYPFKYFEDIGKKLWINFIEKGFDLFLMAIPLLFLPWIIGSANLGTFGSSSGPDAEMTIIILIAILTVSMGLPYFLSRVGAPGYPVPSKLLQNAGITALQTGMQAGMVAFAVGTMGAGSFIGGFKAGMSLLPSSGGGGVGSAGGVGGGGIKGGGGGAGVGQGGLGPAMPLGQAGQMGQGVAGQAGGQMGFWHGLGHHTLEGIKSHLPHLQKHIHNKDMIGLGAHAMGAPISGTMGGLGYLLGRGIGAMLNRSAMKNLPKFLAEKPGFALEPKKFGHIIQNRAKDIASPYSSKAYTHISEANEKFKNAPPMEGKDDVYKNFINEMNERTKEADNDLGQTIGKGIYDNIARYLAEHHDNQLAHEYIEKSGLKME